jgi:thiol-disulfide isomerase/thioredoxin
VIVDFWATFCDPCRKSFPAYQELVDKYAGDLAVIAVSVDDPEDVTVDDVKKFASDLGVSFAIVWDKDKKTASQYNPPKMPTSYIIDKDGVLQHIHAGYESGEADKIDAEVSKLLGK